MRSELTRGISVVVPVYNGGNLLPALVGAVCATADGLSVPYEVILVDDGSEDDTWLTIGRLAQASERIRGIRLMRNYGQHNALLAGIRGAAYDVTVTIDADLQYPAEKIPELVAKVWEGKDAVFGTAGNRTEGLARRAASRIGRRTVQSATGVDITFSSFRAFRTQLRDSFADFGGPYVSIDVLLSWTTRRLESIPVTQSARSEGQSSYSLRSLVRLGLTMVTGFSTRPLRFASLIGFAFTLFGFGLLVYVLVRYSVSDDGVRGLPALASIISIFAGVQLVALGIIGEYLARVHMRVLDPPTYAIREELPSEARSFAQGSDSENIGP